MCAAISRAASHGGQSSLYRKPVIRKRLRWFRLVRNHWDRPAGRCDSVVGSVLRRSSSGCCSNILDGRVRGRLQRIHHASACRRVYVVVATDLLALTLPSPGSSARMSLWDPVSGSVCRWDLAGRMRPSWPPGKSFDGRCRVGSSACRKMSPGVPAYRLSLQTRAAYPSGEGDEQYLHGASVIAVMAGCMPSITGLPAAAHCGTDSRSTMVLAEGLRRHGCTSRTGACLRYVPGPLSPAQSDTILNRARQQKINLRRYDDIAWDCRWTNGAAWMKCGSCWRSSPSRTFLPEELQTILESVDGRYPARLTRTSQYLTHPVFHRYHAEHELLRYIHRLQSRDLSLVHSMIPLGSCTMKLNATAEMLPVTWPEFGRLHPFSRRSRCRDTRPCSNSWNRGWRRSPVSRDFFAAECRITGRIRGIDGDPGVSPAARGNAQRDIRLIPVSAHGTNPASASMCGMTVVPVACLRSARQC